MISINGHIVDGKDDIVMVFLTETDKENIKNMHPDCSVYCHYPGCMKDTCTEAIIETLDDFKKQCLEKQNESTD